MLQAGEDTPGEVSNGDFHDRDASDLHDAGPRELAQVRVVRETLRDASFGDPMDEPSRRGNHLNVADRARNVIRRHVQLVPRHGHRLPRHHEAGRCRATQISRVHTRGIRTAPYSGQSAPATLQRPPSVASVVGVASDFAKLLAKCLPMCRTGVSIQSSAEVSGLWFWTVVPSWPSGDSVSKYLAAAQPRRLYPAALADCVLGADHGGAKSSTGLVDNCRRLAFCCTTQRSSRRE